MRKQAFGIFTMLSLLLVLTAASVNAQSKRSIINIPFSFNVGHKTFPAGEYTVAPVRNDSHNVWQVESRSGDASVRFTTIPVWGSKTSDEPSLVFNKYDGQYFLSQISTGDNSGRLLRMRRFERALAKGAIEREKVVVARHAGD